MRVTEFLEELKEAADEMEKERARNEAIMRKRKHGKR